jgi:thiamine biosynthesis protein ThiS
MPLLTINGESKEVVSTTIEGLLGELSLPVPLMLVEHNGKALHRSEWSSVTLDEGDRLEFMQVAAGG